MGGAAKVIDEEEVVLVSVFISLSPLGALRIDFPIRNICSRASLGPTLFPIVLRNMFVTSLVTFFARRHVGHLLVTSFFWRRHFGLKLVTSFVATHW